MKKCFKFAMLAFAAVATTFTSCSNENDELGVNPDEKKGKLSLSFTPVGLSTKAMDLTHTTAESAVSTVTLFVYKADGSLERMYNFSSSDFTQTGAVYNLNSGKEVEVNAETGKKLLIGVNVPSTLESAIQTNAGAGMSMATAYTEAITNMTTANKFTMFSDAITGINVTGGVTTIVPTANVSRIMAKVSVKYDNTKLTGSTVNVAGGSIDLSSLEWAVENMNPAFRLLQPDGTSAFSPAINWTVPPAITAYQTIDGDNPGAAATLDANPVYVMENIPDLSVSPISDVVTYVRIRCEFTPSQLLDGTGASAGAGTQGDTFWTVPNPKGGVAYFGSQTDADTWSAANGNGTVTEYTDGKCDYGIFITKTAGKYNIIRNHYYAVTISKINGIGVPADPNKPITPTAKGTLTFGLQVNDWIDQSSTEQI